MKRKALIAVLCMVMSVSIMNTGCSGNTSKKEEKHTTETNNKSNKDTEKKSDKKSSEKTETDAKKNVKYEYGMTNLNSVEYVKDPSIPEVGEDGNSMNVPKDILGYYTNGNVGYDFRKIDGNFLVGDKIEFGYRTQSVSVNIMDVTTKGVTINFFADMDESKDILLTKDGFTIENTDEIEKSMLEWMDYCYYLMPMNRGYSEDRVADTFKKYQLGDYVRADYPANTALLFASRGGYIPCERLEINSKGISDGGTYLLDRIPVIQELQTENGYYTHHKTIIVVDEEWLEDPFETYLQTRGLPLTVWLEVKPWRSWFKYKESALRAVTAYRDVSGYKSEQAYCQLIFFWTESGMTARNLWMPMPSLCLSRGSGTSLVYRTALKQYME